MADNSKKLNKKGFIKTYVSGAIRAVVISVFLLLQFSIVFYLSFWISSGIYIYYAISVISVFVIIGLVNKRTNSQFKIGWLVIITLIPIAGLLMYVLWGANRSRRIKRRNMVHIEYGYRFLDSDPNVISEFISENKYPVKMANYMENSHFKLFDHNLLDYFPFGENAFERIEEDLQKAQKFIFLDFFIVAEGALWQRLKAILLERARAGVEIKFLYDDYGSMFRTNKVFWKELKDAGIETAEFNSISRYLDKLYLNYRSHQKIIVIDGIVGYTGGFNIADEYTNEIMRFGIWKDNGVRIEGEGVFGLTATFLQMWSMATEKDVEDYFKYLHIFSEEELSKYNRLSFSQMISDGPANNPENPISDTLLQLIYNARDFLYITTPYLLINDDIEEALTIAAESGIDVRIITPGIPDKKMVYSLTRYNYGNLLAKGIKIYEYTPGFIHAKTFITNGFGIIGTINLDYRSLFLHYECGAFLWDEKFIDTVKQDMVDTISQSREVTYEDWKHRPWYSKVVQPIFYLFSCLI